MKKSILKSLLLIAGLLAGTNVSAYDFEVDGIYYNYNNSSYHCSVTYKDTNYNSYSGDIVIPERVNYNGYSITVDSIGNSAFRKCSNLTSIIIPETVESIGYNAFSSCFGLTEVTIPNSVISIGSYAFESCNGLSELKLANNITSIGYNAFHYCGNLKKVYISDIAKWCNIEFKNSYSNPLYYAKTFYVNGNPIKNLVIPAGITTIKDLAFNGCDSLVSVTFPESVTSIGSCTFQECKLLNEINFSNSIITIGNYAFSGCSELSKLTIPNSVTSIGGGAFSGCNKLLYFDSQSVKKSDNSCLFYIHNNIENVETVGINKYDLFNLYSVYNGWCFMNDVEMDDDNETTIQGAFKYGPNKDKIYTIGGKTISFYLSYGWDNVSLIISDYYCTPATFSCKGYYTGYYKDYDGNHEIENYGYIVQKRIPKLMTGYIYSSIGYEEGKNDLLITGLDPKTEYTVRYFVVVGGDLKTQDYTFTTPDVEFTTLEAKETSNTVAVICAETNLYDGVAGTGFEWRKYDAPDLVPSKKVECPVVNGVLMGALKNLSANTYYKYRPYYTSASGNSYYGEWMAFETSDAYVYFEPMVSTVDVENITDNSAQLKGYAVPGSDNIIEQGFEYWENTLESKQIHILSNTDEVQTVTVSGQLMTVTLENLKPGTTYYYRAYVTTSTGTVYGKENKFTTTGSAGIDGVYADGCEVIEVGRYTIDGRQITKPQHGLNIVRYSDGTVRKEFVK